MELAKAKKWVTEGKREPHDLVAFLTKWLARALHYKEVKEGSKFHWQRTIEDLEMPYCPLCGGDGYVQAAHKNEKNLKTIRCNCIAGQKAHATLPYYNARDWTLI